MDPSLDVTTIGWLREVSGLPVLVKGCWADDADRCMAAGASGAIVSDPWRPTTRTIDDVGSSTTEVVAAVGDGGEVYVDSSLRAPETSPPLWPWAPDRLIGRPALWALATEGSKGVETVLTGLTDGLRRVMGQLGVARLPDLTSDLVA